MCSTWGIQGTDCRTEYGFQADCNRKQVEGLKYGSEIMILKEYSEPHYVIWKMDIGSVRVQGRRQL